VMILDLDHFKSINDQYGHPTGDRVLQQMGECIKAYTRTSDVACRFGGEEFAILLTETARNEARDLANRLRKEIATLHLESVESEEMFTVTASFGVSELRNSDDEVAEVIRRADRALYWAKDKGRDQVVVFEEFQEEK
ncbi:MAG: GGDEF domain-containing protein, partial [bacterium]